MMPERIFLLTRRVCLALHAADSLHMHQSMSGFNNMLMVYLYHVLAS